MSTISSSLDSLHQQRETSRQTADIINAGQEATPACGKGAIKNVGDTERLISLATGCFLTGYGLGRPSLTGLLMAGAGLALAQRGYTGHCSLYAALGKSTAT
jgi:uncharacterized membrane protein